MENWTPINDEDNWLHERPYACDHCKTEMVIADQSPFDTSNYFRCTACQLVAEVDLYHPRRMQIEDAVRAKISSANEEIFFVALMEAIEAELGECACGGSYRQDAAYRCPTCATVIPEVEGGSFIWPISEEDHSKIYIAPNFV